MEGGHGMCVRKDGGGGKERWYVCERRREGGNGMCVRGERRG